MVSTMTPTIETEFNAWDLVHVYWVRVGEWAAVGRIDPDEGLFKVVLNQYQESGPTYRQSLIALEPPARSVSADDIAARLAYAHGIDQPDWLAPALREIISRLNAEWERRG